MARDVRGTKARTLSFISQDASASLTWYSNAKTHQQHLTDRTKKAMAAATAGAPGSRWPKPKNYDHIQQSVLGDGLYTEAKVPPLEAYLQEQVAEASYDFEANKTLLKLYLLYPSLAKQQNVETLLLKALLNLPATDFTLLLYILPEKLQTDETLLTIKDAAEALETARYANLWNVLNARGQIFDAIPKWRDEIRKIILEVHAASYQSVGISTLTEALGLSGAELKSFLNSSEAVASVGEDGQVVHFAPNKENQPRVRKYKEKTDLNNMLTILNRIAA